jgi:two-component system sensor histidine kinase QseC
MDRIVTTLLALARCESGRQTVQVEPVDLRAALAEAWAPLVDAATARQLRVQLPPRDGTPPSTTVEADRALLASVLSNLLSNAVDYTPAGEMVTVSISAAANRLELQVDNVQRELSAGDLDHLFDPFWRKDPARTGGNHAGLGLTLVAAFARLMAVDLVASLPRPDRLRFVLSFPQFKD